ncbi:MAG: PAS domain-containing sensor histidine kinase, partial [Archangium sp.]
MREGFAVFFTDITEARSSRQRELAASDLAENLRRTLDHMGEAFYTLDADWKFAYVNEAAGRLMRTPPHDLAGQVVWSRFPDTLGTVVEKEFRRARDERVPTSFDVYFAPLAGWFEVRATPTAEGISVHFRDITQRKAAEQRLFDQAMLLDQAQDAILVRDLQHSISYWNKGAARCYGWNADEVIGQNARDLLYGELEKERFDEAMAQVLSEGEWRGEVHHRTRDGRTVVIDARWSLLRHEDGTPRSILSINTDVTERKNLEKQFLRAQRLESLGTLAGGIAHDLNNVLAPIVMTASSLRSDEKDPERAEDLLLLVRSAERGADMVKQLPSFARGADGQRVPVELKHVVMDVQQMLRDTFPKNINLQVHVAAKPWTVEGDRTQLNQLLTNLCVNARDAMPQGGTLTIAVEHVHLDDAYSEMNLEAKPGPYVLLRVEDTGTGMSPDVLEHIFEPF